MRSKIGLSLNIDWYNHVKIHFKKQIFARNSKRPFKLAKLAPKSKNTVFPKEVKIAKSIIFQHVLIFDV